MDFYTFNDVYISLPTSVHITMTTKKSLILRFSSFKWHILHNAAVAFYANKNIKIYYLPYTQG